MSKKNITILVCGLTVTVFALVHLLRLFYPFEVSINNFSIPVWSSALFFLVLGAFAAWIFSALGRE